MTEPTERLARNRSLVVLPAIDCVAVGQPVSERPVAVMQFDTGRDGRYQPAGGPWMSTAAGAEILEPADGEIRHAGLVRAGNMAYRLVGDLTKGFAQTLDMVA